MSTLKVLKRQDKHSELQVIDRTAPQVDLQLVLDGVLPGQNIKNPTGPCEVLDPDLMGSENQVQVLRLPVVLGSFGLNSSFSPPGGFF